MDIKEKRDVIFEFQGIEIALTKQEAENLIERIDEAIAKSVVEPKVKEYMEVFDKFIAEIVK